MKIKHYPLFNTEKIVEHYEEKDGVNISYVCTSDIVASDVPVDIFYRDTPHPHFGNHYFGLYYDNVRDHLMITNADKVEDLEFGMIEHEGEYYYSQSHHDYKVVGDKVIDGGRVYCRIGGDPLPEVHSLKVKDGKFFEKK